MARWGIDIDGVLYDFGASMQHYLHTQGWHEGSLSDPTHWDFHEAWGMDRKEFYRHFDEGVDAGVVFIYGSIYPEALKLMKKLRKKKQYIHICTHRLRNGDRSVHNTMDWLKREKVPFDTITFAEDKTSANVDVFIEDNMKNFLALREAGVGAFLIDRPWNRELDTPHRVFSHEEFYQRARAYLDEKGIK